MPIQYMRPTYSIFYLFTILYFFFWANKTVCADSIAIRMDLLENASKEFGSVFVQHFICHFKRVKKIYYNNNEGLWRPNKWIKCTIFCSTLCDQVEDMARWWQWNRRQPLEFIRHVVWHRNDDVYDMGNALMLCSSPWAARRTEEYSQFYFIIFFCLLHREESASMPRDSELSLSIYAVHIFSHLALTVTFRNAPHSEYIQRPPMTRWRHNTYLVEILDDVQLSMCWRWRRMARDKF